MTSFTEENYLKTIYNLSLGHKLDISTNALAEQTQTKAASVSDMLKRLAEKGLVHYKKYQGVRLTQTGELVALRVIRKHRLWEVFLVNHLGFGWDEVHPIAEQLEHIDSEQLVERLDDFLGFPKFDPHGDPIPNQEGQMPDQTPHTLAEIQIGKTVIMMGVRQHTATFLQYLGKIGINLGCRLEVLEINDFDKSMIIKIGENSVFISYEVAKALLVKNDIPSN
jgi:DtxR family transcriptional regulator, Mn-dependent transcriptional regulator